tara:strand:- start:30638 stop:31894 length:1257 start_codon:yes stop_codon:yes gene_type:complete
MVNTHYSILIIGGGAAGITTANTLRRMDSKLDIAIVEPSDKHYYQPAFTLVGGGVYKLKNAMKQERDLIPTSITWIQEYADTFEPENNQVTLKNGHVISYDYLVVCPGIQLDFDKIDGLLETLGKNGVCSNYSPEHVEYTWETVQKLKHGKALFTQPPMPIKCAGAPQKAMYLAADRFRQYGISDKIDVEFFNAGPGMFGVPFFAKALMKVIKKYDIKTNFNHNLVAINGENKIATFEIDGPDGTKQRINEHFDMIHVCPPQSAPDFIKNSPLSNDAGWVEVNHFNLQHVTYSNVFGLGDVTSTPNAKTAAAVRKQAPVVANNILNLINKQDIIDGYNGYGSCPLTTSLNQAMLAEFSYGGKVTPSFPLLDPRTNRRIWWFVKTTGLPWLYWKFMLKGYQFDLPHRESYAKKITQKED